MSKGVDGASTVITLHIFTVVLMSKGLDSAPTVITVHILPLY